MFEKVKKVKRRLGRRDTEREVKNVALFVDGPNMLRKEFNLDLGEVKEEVEKLGAMKIGKVYLDQYAPDKLIEAVANQGFEPTVITTADVDAPMAVDAMEAVYNDNIDDIIIMTRDADFQRLLLKAKEKGKTTVVISTEQIAVALKNTADEVIILK